MILSVTSFFTAVFWGNLLIIFLYFFCSRKKYLYSFSYNILLFSTALILCRFFIPVEFPFTKTVLLAKLYPPIIWFFRLELLNFASYTIHTYDVLLLIWGIGFIYRIHRLWQQYKTFTAALHSLPVNIPLLNRCKKILCYEFSADDSPKKIVILQSCYISSPFITGFFKPVIVLPDIDFTDNELRYILSHEVQHFKFRDMFLKLNIEIIASLFWWNPVIHLLKHQVNNLLELRVDTAISINWSTQQKVDYLQCLANIYERSSNQKYQQLVIGFSKENRDFILVRADSLFYKKKTLCHSVTFAMLSLVWVLISFSLVFEPYSISPDVEKNTFALTDDCYIMLDSDGQYYLYMDDKRMGIVTDPDVEDFENTKFYNDEMGEIRR